MTDLAAIRERHQPMVGPVVADICGLDKTNWPCDTAQVLAALDAGIDVERLAEVVSDSLAATTEGTDWAEAPEPSDEPGSPYVMRLTNEMLLRLNRAALADTGSAGDE